LGGIANYPLAALSHGWWDSQFMAADTAMGFDWKAYWDFATGHSAVLTTFSWVYGSFFVMPSFVVIALIVVGRLDHAYRFIAAFIIALAVTDICIAFFPARSAAANLLPIGASMAPPSGLMHIPIIEHLRDGSLTTVRLVGLTGLVALPSFHAAASLMFAWAGWHTRLMRVPFLLANGLMLLSTPINGGHYLIDVIAGLAVGAAAIGCSYLLSAKLTAPLIRTRIRSTA
jgi:membrane-associated phospholipid phosphatase